MKNVIRTYLNDSDKPVGILVLEEDIEGRGIVHLPYCDTSRVKWTQMRNVWKHLALHLGKSEYIAYIEHRPDVQRLAEYVGFKRVGDAWHYDTNST
jgi:hypothetical protein